MKEPYCRYREVSVIWAQGQTSHTTAFSQSLTQSQALTLFHSGKAGREEEAAEDKSEASRDRFVRFRKEAVSVALSARRSSKCGCGSHSE